MHIGILETGRSLEYLVERHGTFAEMFEGWLGGRRTHIEFSVYAVYQDDFPASPAECDAWLITGSRQGIYERDPWMLRLEEFIRDSVAARVPQVGICFGHQAIASALGGEVVQSERGWGLGTHVVEVGEREAWMQPAAESLALHVCHQDQVVRAPSTARVVASSAFCPASALLYPDQLALSFQGHPEHSVEFARDLIEMRREQGAGATVADAAHASLEGPTDEDLVAEWILRFIEASRDPVR